MFNRNKVIYIYHDGSEKSENLDKNEKKKKKDPETFPVAFCWS